MNVDLTLVPNPTIVDKTFGGRYRGWRRSIAIFAINADEGDAGMLPWAVC